MNLGRVRVMESEPREHESPRCREPVYGRRLEPGDVLEAGDVYDASSGRWERCPCPGLELREGTEAVWVRPA